MGLLSNVTAGVKAAEIMGGAAKGLAEVFVPNATRRMELGEAAHRAALDQHGVEFSAQRRGLFDRIVNGLNRLPRPLLAFGTMGLFVFAMVEPAEFAARMAGLAYVPEPLWWLLGAIVSFYFGAREMHYLRAPERPPVMRHTSAWQAGTDRPVADTAMPHDPNPALEEWQAQPR